LIEFPAHVNVEAPFKQHHHAFTLPDPVPDHLTRFPAHVDVEALRKHGLLEVSVKSMSNQRIGQVFLPQILHAETTSFNHNTQHVSLKGL
jgi:hypothetical protein